MTHSGCILESYSQITELFSKRVTESLLYLKISVNYIKNTDVKSESKTGKNWGILQAKNVEFS